MFVEKKRGQGFVLALSLYPSEERAVPNGSISIKPRINREFYCQHRVDQQ